jgi:hypothetical protein
MYRITVVHTTYVGSPDHPTASNNPIPFSRPDRILDESPVAQFRSFSAVSADVANSLFGIRYFRVFGMAQSTQAQELMSASEGKLLVANVRSTALQPTGADRSLLQCHSTTPTMNCRDPHFTTVIVVRSCIVTPTTVEPIRTAAVDAFDPARQTSATRHENQRTKPS